MIKLHKMLGGGGYLDYKNNLDTSLIIHNSQFVKYLDYYISSNKNYKKDKISHTTSAFITNIKCDRRSIVV